MQIIFRRFLFRYYRDAREREARRATYDSVRINKKRLRRYLEELIAEETVWLTAVPAGEGKLKELTAVSKRRPDMRKLEDFLFVRFERSTEIC